MTDGFKNQFEREFSTCSLRPPDSFIEGNCDMCGKPLPVTKSTGKPAKGRRWCSKKCSNAMLEQHFWTWARKAALKRDKHTCQSCGSTWNKIEVNHQVPLVGKGYGMSCSHHADNLLCLCGGFKGSCHTEVTKAQIAERKRANSDQ